MSFLQRGKRTRTENTSYDERNPKRQRVADFLIPSITWPAVRVERLSYVKEETHEVDTKEFAQNTQHSSPPTLQKLLNSIVVDRIAEFVVHLRFKYELEQNSGSRINPIHCTIVDTIQGSYNMLWRLKFTDGLTMVLKAPKAGRIDNFDNLDAEIIESEAKLMRFLKKKTLIPVPEIYTYDTTFNNFIKCPFILMEYLEGINLKALWFPADDERISRDELEERRLCSLKEIAHAMVQLGQFECETGGSLRFNGEGELSIYGAGPVKMRVVSIDAFLRHQSSLKVPGSVFEGGPYVNPIDMITRENDHYSKSDRFSWQITDSVSQLLLRWVPDVQNPRFVLTHPRLDLENILVAEDGSLVGILGWDHCEGARFEPKLTGGNEAYPRWLTKDWTSPEDIGYMVKNTPEDLNRYRVMYARYIEDAKADINGYYTPCRTKVSLAAGLLGEVAFWPFDRGSSEILMRMFCEMIRGTEYNTKVYTERQLLDGEPVKDEDAKDKAWELIRQIGGNLEDGTMSADSMKWWRYRFTELLFEQ